MLNVFTEIIFSYRYFHCKDVSTALGELIYASNLHYTSCKSILNQKNCVGKLLRNGIRSWLKNDRSVKSRSNYGRNIRVVLSCRNGCCELSCQRHDAEIIQRYKLPAKRARFHERSMRSRQYPVLRMPRIYFASLYADIFIRIDRAYRPRSRA